MSLLRTCRLRPSCFRPRASQTAWMSSLPGSADSGSPSSLAESSAARPSTSTLNAQPDEDYFDSLTSQPSEPSGPPVGTAYPPPQADTNPLRAGSIKVKVNTKYNLYVQSTRNNTIATFTRPDGNPITTISGGKCGFKGVRKSSYEAGYQCAVTMFAKILGVKERVGGDMKLEVLFNGFGQGRDAMYRALMSDEGAAVRQLVSRLTDTTPIKIGGTRAKKARRI